MSGKGIEEALKGASRNHAIKGHQKELEELASSRDGRAVREMLEEDGNRLTQAFQSGDTRTMQEVLQRMAGTKAGASVIKEIQKLLEK